MMTTDRIQAAKTVDLLGLIEKTTTLHKVASHEYAGACPRCGGKDRFRVDPDKGWFCRKCTGEPGSGGHWGDQIDFVMWLRNVKLPEALVQLTGDRGFTKAELEKMDHDRKQREEEREKQDKEIARQSIDKLNQMNDHLIYAEHKNAISEWWKRGINPDWVAYYGLGYCESREYPYDGKYFISDSLTIPYFRYDQINEKYYIVDLKHRLLKDDCGGGKYRHHISGCGNHLFFADILAQKPIGDILIVEGEIKAMITWQYCWDGENCEKPDLSVISVPGKTWKQEWIEMFKSKNVDRVFVCLDPDANRESERLASMIGNAVSFKLPAKIDDLFLAGALDHDKLTNLLETSWKNR